MIRGGTPATAVPSTRARGVRPLRLAASSDATMIAAMMTAANLGARVTGWGFVVFTIGSVCWSLVGLGSGQMNLLATNVFLTAVNLVGIWRWLRRQRAYEDGGKSAERASRRSSAPSLLTATGIAGMPAIDPSGAALGNAVEALVECASGQVSYVVIASGGLGGITKSFNRVEHHDQLVEAYTDYLSKATEAGLTNVICFSGNRHLPRKNRNGPLEGRISDEEGIKVVVRDGVVTGAILLGTVLDELERTGGRYGLVTMCAAGGMAPAIVVERL